MERITAVFENMNAAEAAVRDLRREGVADDQLSIVTRHPEAEKHEGKGEAAAKGAGIGAGAGAVLGIAAAFIPGVGPFITAGVLTSWLGTVAGGAAAGAAVGGVSGAVAAGLEKAGYEKEEARYYGEQVEQGNVLIAVDARDESHAEEFLATMARHGGHTHEAHV